ncbi:hypothetical protein [Bifidobacterium panos]|uniref:Uncharacterized protein n=1 Tax=Bifidobacterium panos TaxID=2675321 RepID=A0ABX1SYB9_9BIFI|nr:hypothetical protein [Bifidobacterium sp. DSM 109963]NMN02839.1 hypothetical protein [Bifidobacterium sp. DSM 109963]
MNDMDKIMNTGIGNGTMKIVDARLLYDPAHFKAPAVRIQLTLQGVVMRHYLTFKPKLLPRLLDVAAVEIGENGVADLQWLIGCPVKVELNALHSPTALINIYDESKRLSLEVRP